MICQEGQSIVWLSHGTKIVRCSPENLRPASLREWQYATATGAEMPSTSQGGASTFLDISGTNLGAPRSCENGLEGAMPPASVVQPAPVPVSFPSASRPSVTGAASDGPESNQPEQELTPLVSRQPSEIGHPPPSAEVERDGLPEPSASAPLAAGGGHASAVPGTTTTSLEAILVPDGPEEIPLPNDVDDDLFSETIFLASQDSGLTGDDGQPLLHVTTLESSSAACGPPLAEDNLPFVENPLQCSESQAFYIEVDLKPKDLAKWMSETAPEQLATVAAVAKRARAEVKVKDLSPREVELFNIAKDMELQCWVQTSAIKNILKSRLNPEQILKSRWVLTWKPPEEPQQSPRAKARLVVLGYQDPKLVEVMRDAPTLSREGRALVLQTLASCRFPLSSFDIKTAFLRGHADETNPLAMEPPLELRKMLQLKDNEVCQLLGNAYGRVDAPLLFYRELSQQLLGLGFVRHPLEPCVFMLYHEGTLRGIIGMHVDDGVCGGDKMFFSKLEALQKHLPFGSQKHQSFVFTGIRLAQLPDGTIRASQSDYVTGIPSIDVGKPRRQEPSAPVSEFERSKLRGLIGSLQYAASHTRPDIAAKVGELQAAVTRATVQTLLDANKVLRETQQHSEVKIHFRPIPPKDLTFVSFGDASFASSKNLSSHQGAIICATNTCLAQNQEAPVSFITWVSKKIPRVVRSTLSAEAYSMSKAVDVLGWIRSLWGVVHIDKFPWAQPEQSYRLLNQAIIVTDCKSLYDLVTRLATPACEEYRTTLEVLLIKQRCMENAQFRWIPTTLMIADSLTKSMDPALLRAVMSQSRFRLYDGNQSLEKCAQCKEAVAWISKP